MTSCNTKVVVKVVITTVIVVAVVDRHYLPVSAMFSSSAMAMSSGSSETGVQ